MNSRIIIEELTAITLKESSLLVFRCKERPTEEEVETIRKLIESIRGYGTEDTEVLCVGPDWSVEVYQKSRLEEGGKDAVREMPGTDG